MTRRIAALAAIGLLLVLAACRGVGGGSGQTLSLDGTWQLVSGTHQDVAIPLVTGREVTLVIDGDRVGGRVCNLYSGTIAVSGSSVTLGSLAMTDMGCDEPLMTLETAYHAALAAVDTAGLNGDVLTLTGPRVELRFSRVPPVADAALVGTTWQLDSLISGDAASSVADEPAILVFAQDGTLDRFDRLPRLRRDLPALRRPGHRAGPRSRHAPLHHDPRRPGPAGARCARSRVQRLGDRHQPDPARR